VEIPGEEFLPGWEPLLNTNHILETKSYILRDRDNNKNGCTDHEDSTFGCFFFATRENISLFLPFSEVRKTFS